MKKKIIFQVVTHFDVGGAERIAFNIAKSKSQDFEYHVVEVAKGNSKYTEKMLAELKENGIAYHRSDVLNNKKAILSFPFRMKKLYDQYHPDVIQTHTEAPDLAVFLFHKFFPWCKFKLVRTLHNTKLWSQWRFIGKLVEKYIQNCDANVSNSLAVTKAYVEAFGGEKNIRLIYNGFAPSNQIKYSGLVEGKLNILFAGRFVPQKGLDVLVEVIKRTNPNKFFFHVAGKGPLDDVVNEGVGKMQNVKIIPPIPNLSSYVGSFDYVIIPSVHEGLNSLSIEASMNGTPAIVNDIAGLNETLPSDWKLKVTNNSVEQYLDILNVLSTLDYDHLKEYAFGFASCHFSISKMQSEYEKIYE